MTVSTIFFDFDGVILESVNVKTAAFSELFERYGPSVQEAAVAHHLMNLGRSRYEKFRFVYEDLLFQPLSDATMSALCSEFEELVVDRVLRCPYVDGAREFLEIYSSRFACYVVSATPHLEIGRIVESRGLAQWFVGVHGSPTTKEEWIRTILTEGSIPPQEAVFIGDALADHDAATKCGIRFIGRIANDQSPLHGLPCDALLENLHLLPMTLDSL